MEIARSEELYSWSPQFFHFGDAPIPVAVTLSLHDALPIWVGHGGGVVAHAAPDQGADAVGLVTRPGGGVGCHGLLEFLPIAVDRKSTRLNSSHRCISYAVSCLKKKTFTKPAWPS